VSIENSKKSKAQFQQHSVTLIAIDTVSLQSLYRNYYNLSISISHSFACH